MKEKDQKEIIPLFKKLLEGKKICPSKEKFYLNTLKRRMEFLTNRINNSNLPVKGFNYDTAERNSIAFILGKLENKNKV